MGKLYYLGIKGKCLNWILDYLNDRSQSTVCNNVLSKPEKVICGVPQGFLGPLFFLVYINDVQGVFGNIKHRLYADDTVIYCSGKNYILLQDQLQVVLNKFTKWCNENALTISTNKTKLMTFGSRSNIKISKEIEKVIGKKQIKAVPTYKYLGINLDQTLSFNYFLSPVIQPGLPTVPFL